MFGIAVFHKKQFWTLDPPCRHAAPLFPTLEAKLVEPGGYDVGSHAGPWTADPGVASEKERRVRVLYMEK